MYIQQLHETNRWFSNQYLCVVFSLDYKRGACSKKNLPLLPLFSLDFTEFETLIIKEAC